MAQQINLYNPALRRQRELLTLPHVTLAAMTLLLVLLAVGGVFQWRAGVVGEQLREVEGRIAAETQRMGDLTARATRGGGQQEVAALQQQIAERREILALLQSGVGVEPGGAGFADYLRGLARQSVAGLWLTGFSVARGGEAMEIRGRMVDAARLPDYIRRLNSERNFHGRQFLSLSVERPEAGSAATLAPGVPAAVAPAHNSFVLTGIPVAGAAADKGSAR